jgi:hypothetical protein
MKGGSHYACQPHSGPSAAKQFQESGRRSGGACVALYAPNYVKTNWHWKSHTGDSAVMLMRRFGMCLQCGRRWT